MQIADRADFAVTNLPVAVVAATGDRHRRPRRALDHPLHAPLAEHLGRRQLDPVLLAQMAEPYRAVAGGHADRAFAPSEQLARAAAQGTLEMSAEHLATQPG